MTTEQNNFIAEETEVAQAQPVSESISAEETREIVEEVDYKSWSKEDLIKGFQEASKSGLIQQAIKTATKIKSAIEEKIQEDAEAEKEAEEEKNESNESNESNEENA